MKVEVKTKKINKHGVKDNNREIKQTEYGIKKWLEEKRIYFDTIIPLLLTVISLVLSILALIHSHRSAADEAKLNMPLFNTTNTYTNEQISIDGLLFPQESSIKYEMANQGGNLTSGEALAFEILHINVFDSEYREVVRIQIKNFSCFFNSFSRYSFATNSFVFYRRLHHFELSEYLHEQLKQEYPYYSFSIYTADYAVLTYHDYKGAKHIEWYDLYDGSKVDNPEGNNLFYHSWNSDSTVEAIYEMIYPSLLQVFQELNDIKTSAD